MKDSETYDTSDDQPRHMKELSRMDELIAILFHGSILAPLQMGFTFLMGIVYSAAPFMEDAFLFYAGFFGGLAMLNTLAARRKWPVEDEFDAILQVPHGVLLFIALYIGSLPLVPIYQVAASMQNLGLILILVVYMVYVFLFGFIGRYLAVLFTPTFAESKKWKLPPFKWKCPYCGFTSLYRRFEVSKEGTCKCKKCGEIIQIEETTFRTHK